MSGSSESLTPLRLLVNGLHAKTGGGVTYLRNMLPLLAAEPGLDVHLCLHADQAGLFPNPPAGVTVHRFAFRPGFWRLLVREQVEVPRLARAIEADVTLSPANYGPLLAPNPVILLRNALGVAFVERRPVKLVYWLLLYAATAASLIACRRAIAVSDYAGRSVAGGLLGFLKDRITVIPHGVAEIFSAPAADRPREAFLLAVSDIYVQKNLKNLLLAVSRLRAEHPEITLKVAGRAVDAGYFAEVQRTVAEQGLQGAVEFLGHVAPEGLAELYRRCRIFVFPSSVETFGNPLVEAMASGAPIASSRAAAMPEVLGEAAAYFDPANVADMAAVLGRLLGDEAERRKLSERALERSRRFSWRATAEKTLDVIRGASKPARRG